MNVDAEERFLICEEMELKKFDEGYNFAKEQLVPFASKASPQEDDAYMKYLGKVANSVYAYEDLIAYRTPKKVLTSGTNYTCPVCERVVKDTDHFCSYCGQRLDFNKEEK